MQQFVEPHFQAIRPCKGNGPQFAVEALFRFRGDATAPEKLIAHWERTGYIKEVDKLVVREVHKIAAAAGYADRIALNVSVRTIQDDAIEYLKELRRITPHFAQVMVEITETYEIRDVEMLAWFARQCQAAGIQVGLDDCTPTYELIAHPSVLLDIKPDFVKIDAGTVNAAFVAGAKMELARVAKPAWAAGAVTIAEGIDSVEKLEFVQKAGINYWQGFLQSEPVSLSDLIAQERRRLRKNRFSGWLRGATPSMIA